MAGGKFGETHFFERLVLFPWGFHQIWWVTWKRGAASSENRRTFTLASGLRWQVYHGSCAARNWAGPQRGNTRSGSSRLSAMRHSPGAQPGETRYRSWTQRGPVNEEKMGKIFFYFLFFFFNINSWSELNLNTNATTASNNDLFSDKSHFLVTTTDTRYFW